MVFRTTPVESEPAMTLENVQAVTALIEIRLAAM